MRFLAQTNSNDDIFEIDTAHDEFTPQALRTALALMDKQAVDYTVPISAMMGRNRCILVMKNKLGQVRIEVYMRRTAVG